MQNPTAVFIRFENYTNWCGGTVGKYRFAAKLFDEPSGFGIKDGRVSKLSIWDEDIRQEKQCFFSGCVVNYDRGWDIKPKKEIKPFFSAVMELLENAPKRFTVEVKAESEPEQQRTCYCRKSNITIPGCEWCK